MARQQRNSRLETREQRLKLRARADRTPYSHLVHKRLYLDYRKPPGTWYVRKWNGTSYQRREIGAADDRVDADGKTILTFEQALKLALAEAKLGFTARYSVESLIVDYVDDRRTEKGDAAANAAEQILKKSFAKRFKERDVAELDTDALKRWRNSFVPHGDDVDEEAQRRAKDTANRHWNTARAALALAFRDGKVKDDSPWRRIKPFANVGKARQFYPNDEQVKALLDHCDDALGPLASSATETGFRLKALTGALVKDLDEAHGTLNIEDDKGHTRVATLSSAAVKLFKQQAKDKLPSAYLFLRADGEPWTKSTHHRPFRDAVARTNADPNVKKQARLPREFIFYSLRHYFISRALLAGVHVNALAKNVGTSAAMIEKHYGKFIRSDVRDMLDRVATPARA